MFITSTIPTNTYPARAIAATNPVYFSHDDPAMSDDYLEGVDEKVLEAWKVYYNSNNNLGMPLSNEDWEFAQAILNQPEGQPRSIVYAIDKVFGGKGDIMRHYPNAQIIIRRVNDYYENHYPKNQ